MIKNKWNKKKLDYSLVIPAIAEGIIANQDVANGRFIPAIILDENIGKDIKETLRMQATAKKNGTVTTTWGKEKNDDIIYLVVSFTSPVEKEFIIEFKLLKYVSTIDFIVNSQLLYIMAGKEGEKISHKGGDVAVLIEVPSEYFVDDWISILKKRMISSWKKDGMKKKELNNQFDKFYSEWNKIKDVRFKRK